MAVKTGQLAVNGSLRCTLTKTQGSFQPSQMTGIVSFNFALDASIYTEVYLGEFTLVHTASPIHTVDLRAITDLLGDTATGTGVIALVGRATGSGGKVRIAPGATNGLVWPFADASSKVVFSCGIDGCGFVLADGLPATIDSSHKTLDFDNPGSADCSVKLGAIIKTT